MQKSDPNQLVDRREQKELELEIDTNSSTKSINEEINIVELDLDSV